MLPPIDSNSHVRHTTPVTASRPTQSVAPTQCLTPPQVQQLAQRYAPVLYLHPDEHNNLEDPLQYIADSSLRSERDFWPDREIDGTGDVQASDLPQYGDSDTFLDHGDSKEARAGNNERAPMLYQYDAASNTMTYHLFYAYNDGPGPQNHEGDWEAITVQLDSTNQPTDVYYSGHGAATHRSWADAPQEGGRPVSYVAQGSHANYPGEGRWETALSHVYDTAQRTDQSTRVDLADHLAVDVTTEAYYGSGIGWGERGSLKEFGPGDTSGPTGPSPDKINGILKARADAEDKQPSQGLSLLEHGLDGLLGGIDASEQGARTLKDPLSGLLDHAPNPLAPLAPVPVPSLVRPFLAFL